jgi:hypothetical protein
VDDCTQRPEQGFLLRIRDLGQGWSFVVPGPSGAAVRDRLKDLTAEDERVLRLVGDHLGTLAALDLKERCTAGLEPDSEQWARRKRALTQVSSSRWAGAITKATHDQWALARRAQLADIRSLEAGVRTIAYRLSLPVGEKGARQASRAAGACGERPQRPVRARLPSGVRTPR